MFVDSISLFFNQIPYIFLEYSQAGRGFQRSLFEPKDLRLRSNAGTPARLYKTKRFCLRRHNGRFCPPPFSPVAVLFPRILTPQDFPTPYW